ncbi:transmembrane repetitive protein [Lysobacter fragariae]
MASAAEIILAIQRRLLLAAPHLMRAPGEFPAGWKNWFATMTARVGAVTGVPSQAIVDLLAQRPPRARPRRTGELTQWEAFATLWRQEWTPPEPEERKVRWFAAFFTVLWHLVFGGLLLWLMYVRFMALEDEASKRRGEEEVVQVEFIGRGTPDEIGGGQTQEQPEQQPEEAQEAASSAAEAAAASASSASPALPSPALEAPSLEAPVPDVQQRDIPEPQIPPTPPVQQPVVVSAPTPEPTDFVLPPPTPRTAQPQVSVPDITAPTAQVRPVDVPEPLQPISRELPQPQIVAPQVQARVRDVTVREVAAPLQQVRATEIATRPVVQPALRAPDTTVRSRDIPAPRPANATAPAATSATASTSTSTQTSKSTAPAAANATKSPAAASSSSTTAASSSQSPATATRPAGSAPSTATSGQGPKPIAAPGAFPSPAKSDDWGASTRNVPGGQRGEPSGLYNAEGGPRLTEKPVNTGHPPGTLDDRIVDLDRSGTWLKRKPNDYEPTAFDKYWIPNETLLAEWVRKGIKTVSIPIPGTSKKIQCVVSMLALGGGCGISDPNLNDQPATARPPPNVPFKPHLQEDNGSVKPPPKTTP